MIARVILVLLTAPWRLLASLLGGALGLARLPGRIKARSADCLYCPDGHPNPVMGRWSCRCGAHYLGHVFAPCPNCGLPAGWVRCAVCDLAILSPWRH